MEFAHVELEANDGKHEDGEEEKQPDLQERDHGLHYGLEHHLQTWARAARAWHVRAGWVVRGAIWGANGGGGRLANAWAAQDWRSWGKVLS